MHGALVSSLSYAQKDVIALIASRLHAMCIDEAYHGHIPVTAHRYKLLEMANSISMYAREKREPST